MLATLSPSIVEGPEWVFEEKYDGIRSLAARERGRVKMWSRMLQDLTAGFPHVALAVAALPGGDLLLDGELVALDEKGVSRFQLLQRRGTAGAAPTRYAVFDLLELEGRSLLRRPLGERRTALERLLRRRTDPLFLSRRLVRNGKAAYREAKRLGWEGIIAKDEHSIYEPGVRSRYWRKVKVRKESEFVIGGFTPPKGVRQHLGALLVGLYDGPKLRYVGKVGTGFTQETLDMLAAKLDRLRTAESPFDPPPRIPEATWVRPKLVPQIAYAEWTADGKLRQPAFLGLRTDKDPAEVTWSQREP
ncbi:MAG TPA: non-homologous end-joining DNA ligase [Candidatus Limnocylindria bacterium]|jgi:bifunctional non-homologous end joining protein LigD|nr:non-homologous end-joining DNA ligase [Candidatus Limnocylindria bacterium]